MSRTITKNRATNEKKVCIESSSSAAPSQTATPLLDCATSTNCDRDGDCRGIETPRKNAALALMNAMSCSAPIKLVQQMMAVKRPYDSQTALRSTASKRLHLTKRNVPAVKANKFSSICVGGGGGAEKDWSQIQQGRAKQAGVGSPKPQSWRTSQQQSRDTVSSKTTWHS